jgi:hypothetical protein
MSQNLDKLHSHPYLERFPLLQDDYCQRLIGARNETQDCWASFTNSPTVLEEALSIQDCRQCLAKV